MKNILVADDSSFFRSQVVKTLQTSGYQVTEAKDGQEALELLLLDPCIEIAIVDWNMPYLNGPEVCKQVRKLRPESYVYFILLTSQEGIEHLIEGMDSGADDYITKSQSLDEVHARLRAGSRIVDLHRSLHEEKERLSEANTALRETTKRLKEKEQELHDTLVLQNEVLSSIPSFCISLDTDYTVKTWNKRAEELFGLSSPEVCKKPIQALPLHWDISQITSSLEWCSLHIRPVELQSLRYNQIDGLLGKELDVCITPIESAEKVIEGYLLTGIDVTHSRQLERELAQKSRLESIGNLSAGIAHEINTPIQYVRDNTVFLLDELRNFSALLAAYEDCVSQLGPEFQEFIRQVKQHVDYDCLIQEIPLALTQTLEGVESVAKIVRSMKEFAHPSSEEKSLCDINANISNIMTVARNEWKYVADIELDLDRGLPEVFCHRGEINQVLLNLIVNASHAIKESSRPWGTITIQTQHKENEICISISDTGCGIPSEVRNRIFDPFFTTKDVGTGTGQGLTLAYTTIVERHGGRFDFESTEGIGSRFWFTLPLRPRDLDLCSNHSGGVR